jgi:hypothetical protein
MESDCLEFFSCYFLGFGVKWFSQEDKTHENEKPMADMALSVLLLLRSRIYS